MVKSFGLFRKLLLQDRFLIREPEGLKRIQISELPCDRTSIAIVVSYYLLGRWSFTLLTNFTELPIG
jgi:hypothetical protein